MLGGLRPLLLSSGCLLRRMGEHIEPLLDRGLACCIGDSGRAKGIVSIGLHRRLASVGICAALFTLPSTKSICRIGKKGSGKPGCRAGIYFFVWHAWNRILSFLCDASKKFN